MSILPLMAIYLSTIVEVAVHSLDADHLCVPLG